MTLEVLLVQREVFGLREFVRADKRGRGHGGMRKQHPFQAIGLFRDGAKDGTAGGRIASAVEEEVRVPAT